MDIQRQGQLVEVLGSEMSNKYSVNTADSSANTKTHSFGGRFLISEPVVKFFHDGRELKISPNKDEDPYAAIARYVFELNDEIEKLKSELAKAQAVPEGFVLINKSDRNQEMLELIDQRDYMESQAEELKDKLQALYGVDFGEHSNCNFPFQNAIDYDDSDLVLVPKEPTQAMLDSARDWSTKKYGKAVGNDGASGCYKAMIEAQEPAND